MLEHNNLFIIGMDGIGELDEADHPRFPHMDTKILKKIMGTLTSTRPMYLHRRRSKAQHAPGRTTSSSTSTHSRLGRELMEVRMTGRCLWG
jgi:hypothetical protein